ncbi:MAG: RNA methyltransferase [Cytophagales bacterium]|nr:RNA methyltransferase [Cytophagales bacterium]
MRKLRVEELGRMDAAEFAQAGKMPLTVVLDNVRSMHNVGSAFRTADAFRVEQILLCGITACPPHREIHKTALGAENTVHWAHYATTLEAIRWLKAEGYQVLAVEQTDRSQPLHTLQVKKEKHYALVFGNEAFGVDDDALAECHIAVEIPQYGTKHSLNISVSLGIVVWEMAQRLLIPA